MTFYCIRCSVPLAGTGKINWFVCDKCKCVYEVKIEIHEVIGPKDDTRKLPEAGRTEEDYK